MKKPCKACIENHQILGMMIFELKKRNDEQDQRIKALEENFVRCRDSIWSIEEVVMPCGDEIPKSTGRLQ